MSNSDILSKADRVLRPVLKELERFPWIRVEGCCAGHKQEDNLWLEVSVMGSTGLRRLMQMMKILDRKLTDTECRIDCLLSYDADEEGDPVPHGWTPTAIEIFWPARADWKRSQSMVIETLLSSLEEFGPGGNEPLNPPCAINYCPFCSSSFLRIDAIDNSGTHRYRCGDCDVVWTMVDPVI